ncbi:outer membrane protein assembly factor BamB family protein [Chitinophaga cymbidii]|uniref:Cytochrome c domain-containing protein n=1 Tax=Chitinophaga cymbidii TaxID=1096750 RepID=A0A512RLY1_9BACT|nr:PQQ-binding-like beta-propeller repeat protein [Chitinophaga cymbidii]GEP96682.1 hypothetical protein CCY01nite_29420 [Chitinophaga cymbidii]
MIARYVILAAIFLSCCRQAEKKTSWAEYLGGPDRNHYSSLDQINTTNVGQLRIAWEYHAGDSGQVQCNPIIIDSVLYGVTAYNHVFALHAGTGKEIWRNRASGEGAKNVNRGVTYWEDGDDKRILFAYADWLAAVDARTGTLIPSFGDSGKVSLKTGLGADAADKYVCSTTPGTLFNDLIIMPVRVGEGEGAADGHVQAFNVRTGKLAWVFHTIPQPGEKGYETWPANAYRDDNIGGVNSWPGMSIDRERGIVFVPTGSPAFDFYGGERKGQNLFANCVLALKAATGEYLWHFQTVHHDVWDRDLPAPPNLVTIHKDGKRTDAVAQITKSGYIFLFDRETGTPLYPVEERPFPASTLAGEETWPTQPVPVLPKPFTRQNITEKDISPFAENKEELLRIYHDAQKGTFRPLALNKMTILFPGADGGAEWGGAAVDPEGILYVNSNEMAWLLGLVNTPASGAQQQLSQGNVLYNTYCTSCHSGDRKGNPNSGYPSLEHIKQRMPREQVAKLIMSGKGMMPGFTNISAIERQAIIDFLFDEEKTEAPAKGSTIARGPYQFTGYNKFLDSKGYPAISPPWGMLTAIDLNTGQHLWQQTLGDFSELSAKGNGPTGTENYGGPVVTAGGLLFIAATKDGMFRAFDKRTGKLCWETKLPAAGFATPATYEWKGKQYVVVACGGTKLGAEKGDSYVAFVLP